MKKNTIFVTKFIILLIFTVGMQVNAWGNASLACKEAASPTRVTYMEINHVSAIELCEAAIAADPNNAELWAYAARAHWKLPYENPQTYDKALEWATRSAEKGNAVGQYVLAFMKDGGRLKGSARFGAEKFYRRSAKQKYAPAQYELGNLFLKGSITEGGKDSKKEAIRLYELAAEQGMAEAQMSLGWAYEQGYHLEKNYPEALTWFKKAALLGNKKALDNVISYYKKGQGVEKDPAELKKWVQLSTVKKSELAIKASKQKEEFRAQQKALEKKLILAGNFSALSDTRLISALYQDVESDTRSAENATEILTTRIGNIIADNQVVESNGLKLFFDAAKGASSPQQVLERMKLSIVKIDKLEKRMARLRAASYGLKGNICNPKYSVWFCSSTTQRDTSYLGRGLLMTKNRTSNTCSGACSNASGLCDVKTGKRYYSSKEAELDNCLPASNSEIKQQIRIQ